MKLHNPFSALTKFEWSLWLSSILAVILTFVFSSEKDVLTLIGSLIGVTSLIFLAKGFVIGQILMIVFATFYGFVSYHVAYYGEMITYMCMSLPLAVINTVSWLRHPFRDTAEVEVSRKISRRQKILLPVITLLVTVAFYFILGALNTARLTVSTISVATSFFAAYLTSLRSPWYALAYSCNDVVLITLWVMATVKDISSLPMVICFTVFFFNDLYVFISWQRMARRQSKIVENL